MSNTYSSAAITLDWNSEDLSDGYINVSSAKDGALVQRDFDSRGKMTVSLLAGQGATFEIEYREGCKSLDFIDSIAALQQTLGHVPFRGIMTLNDPVGNTGKFVAWDVVLESAGDRAWGEASGTRTVTFGCEKRIDTDNVADVLANIAQYVLQ